MIAVLMSSMAPVAATHQPNYTTTLESMNYAPSNTPTLKLNTFSSALQLWRDAHVGANPSSLSLSVLRPQVNLLDFSSYLVTPDQVYQADGISAMYRAPDGYKKHNPIVIDNERDLRKYPGSGTATDPYVIEGFFFANNRKNLVTIMDVSVYIEFRNNYMDNLDSSAAGVMISNAAHVSVHDNNILSNGNGVLVSGSTDVHVDNNILFDSANTALAIDLTTDFTANGNTIYQNVEGMTISNSNNGDISYNTVFNNTGDGITLDNSNYNSLAYNTIYDNLGNGVQLLDSSNNLIDHNDIYSNGPAGGVVVAGGLRKEGNSLIIDAMFSGSGIYLDPSIGNTITNNELSGNAGSGILSEYSSGSVIDQNNIDSNGVTGLFLLDSDGNTITGNNVTNSGDTSTFSAFGFTGYDLVKAAMFSASGIYLDPSTNNEISGNKLNGNIGNGVFVDDSTFTTIAGNDITNNGLNAVFLQGSDDNSILGNTISKNGALGLSLSASFAGNAFDQKLFAMFSASGIYLDPSMRNNVVGNTITDSASVGVVVQLSDSNSISGNSITGSGAEGIFLEDSNSNTIDGNILTSNGYATSNGAALLNLLDNSMQLMAMFSGSGIYLDPSTDNKVTNNQVSGSAGSGLALLSTDNTFIDGNSITNNQGYGVELVDSDSNTISMNVIDNNGAASAGLLSLSAMFSGSGIYLDPSYDNAINYNNATGNGDHGLEIVASFGTTASNNRFINNGGYGVTIDSNSGNSHIDNNNFDTNNGNATQAADSGSSDVFSANYYQNADHTDANYDGITDVPYTLDGTSGTQDTTASNIANGLNYFTTSDTTTNPTKLNADSEGTPLTVVITMSQGYRALNVTASDFTLNGTASGVDATINNILQFKILFDRLVVNELINEIAAQRGWVAPFTIVFEVHGRMNLNLLDITAYATLIVNQTGTPLLSGSQMLIVGAIMALPITKFPFKKKEDQ